MGIAAGAARHDLAAGNPDMNLKRTTGRLAYAGHRLVDVDSGADGALRIVGMGNRRAEHRHNVVADMFVDTAAKSLNDAVHGLEIPVEQRMRCFRAKLARKRGKPG